MFGLIRRYFLIIALVLSAAIPFFATGEGWETVKNHLPTFGAGSDDAAALEGETADTGAAPVTAHLEGPEVTDLRQIFRFDMTPQMIVQNWTRVTTVLGETELEGMRVPVVTGTNIDDLAGSLTYYFDKNQQVQRIAFHGDTGDARRVIALASETYGLKHTPSLEAGLYVQKWNGAATSALRVTRAAVVRANEPHSQLNVALELNRPGDRYGLSSHMQHLLKH